MKTSAQRRNILILSLLLSALIIISSSIGLFSNDFYRAETSNWQSQAIGQDIIDLFLVTPLLLVIALFYWKGIKLVVPIHCGLLLYLIYTFLIYSFSIHFNQMFIVYCLILGLSFYILCYIIFNNIPQIKQAVTLTTAMKATAIYLIVVALLFYLLWLAQIIPSIARHTTPPDLVAVGLITNPIHVIDLSVCLPGIFLTGVFILKKKSIGFFLAPAILVFMILMDITIGFLAWFMKEKGVVQNATMSYVMFALALFSFYLLLRISRTSVESEIV